MLVYLSICSLIGSLSVVATQGLGILFLLTLLILRCCYRRTSSGHATVQSMVLVCFTSICCRHAVDGDRLSECIFTSGISLIVESTEHIQRKCVLLNLY